MKNLILHISIWGGLFVVRVLALLEYFEISRAIATTLPLYIIYILVFYGTAIVYKKFSTKLILIQIVLYILILVLGTSLLRYFNSFLEANYFIFLPRSSSNIFGGFRIFIFQILGLLYQILISKREILVHANSLKLEKNKTELEFLKNQINPHFFFNTLNNIYGLAYKKDDKTPEVILKLSESMRYIIYDAAKKYVYLNDEIDFLKNYIHLEKIRLSNKSDIKFNYTILTNNYKIAPLILLPFVENCFKHGNLLNDNSILEMNLWIENQRLFFSCFNTFEISDTKKIGGVGNKNVNKRLELIYKDNYMLDTKVEENKYFVFLELPLNS